MEQVGGAHHVHVDPGAQGQFGSLRIVARHAARLRAELVKAGLINE